MGENSNRYKAILKKAANKIEELNNEINYLSQEINERNQDIAIIGYSCRFPGGANDAESFWNILANGIDTVKEISEDRFDTTKYYSENNNKNKCMITKNAALLDEDIKLFDNTHFEISGVEATSMDPQQRLLLEVSWEALENAALNIEKLKGSRTGVYVAINSFEYGKQELFSGNISDITTYSTTGTSHNCAGGKLAYFYDFKGPAVACDTACSSSIVALNMAVDSLKNNQCDMAIVGGVNLLLEPENFVGLSKFDALSKDGRCKAFDESADGFGRGEGCGVVILKRLKDAKIDENEILALIKGVAVGQDGKTNGFTAPNGLSQQNVIMQALNNAKLNVNDIDYIETHGTGTSLGDLIEAQAISNVFKEKEKKILIGTVKTNIAHLEAASGMAGLIKVLLALENKKLPPNIHFNDPNPNINWDRVKVVDKLIDWEPSNGVRRAGISSFGFSGTLAHVIIEEAPKEYSDNKLDTLPHHIITISAKSNNALYSYMKKIREYILQKDIDIGDIAYTTNISRSYNKYRIGITGNDKEEVIKKIDDILKNYKSESYILNKNTKNNKIAFLFTGQGSLYKEIAKNLFKTSKVFRDALNLCNEKFREILNINILDGLYGDNEEMLYNPIYSQTTIFSVEYALTKVWDSLGIKPYVVIGHSIGEYVAACYSGLITLDDAIKMVSIRCKVIMESAVCGKMVGILTNVNNVRAAIEESLCKNVSIAAINAPENVTISGKSDEVDEVLRILQNKHRVFINKLNINQPFHSTMMVDCMKKYDEDIKYIEFSKPKINIISSITGNLEKEECLGKTQYWAKHLCNTVNFEAAIESAKKLGVNIFIEIGGDATLSGLANQCINDENVKFVPSLRKGVEDYKQLFNSIIQLYHNGIDFNWNLFYKTYKKSKVNIPNYSFQKKSFWPNLKNKYIIEGKQEESFHMQEIQQNNENNKNIKVKIELDLKEMIKELTWLEIDEIDSENNLFSLGFDSLVLVELNKKISSKYMIEISLSKFFVELDTIEKIVDHIIENVNGDVLSNLYETNSNLKFLDKTLDSYYNSHTVSKIGDLETISSNRYSSEIKELFKSQVKLMEEQLEILKNISNGNKTTKDNNVLVQRKNTEKINNQIENRKPNYYVPYKKLDFGIKEKMDDLKLKYIKNIERKYTSYYKSSKENTQRYRKVYANNRNVAGFRPVFKEMIYQIVANKGYGSKIYDLDNNELIDITMGFGVNLFGHRPKFVERALNEEIINGMPLGPMGRLSGQVAEQICDLTGVERVAFYNSGTEANMVAVRIARAITGKKKIIIFSGAYHGTYDGFLGLSSTSKTGEKISIPMAPGIMDSMIQDLIILPYNNESSIEYILKNSDDIAGVLVETVQSRRPDLQPKEFLMNLRKVTENNNIALIFDEIITGFRIAAGGAQEYFGIKADIVTFGKIAGGGMPIGIVAGKSNYMDSIDGGMWNYGDDSVPPCEEKRTFVAGTFSHHPLAMATANATLKYIKENKDMIYDKLNEKTKKFVDKVNSYFKDENIPIEVVNFGSLFRFVLRGDFEIFFYGLLEKGIYIWEGRNCFLSTEHSDDDIEKLILAIKLTVEEMKAAGYFEEKKINETEEAVVKIENVPNFEMSSMQKSIFTQSITSEEDPYKIISIFRIIGRLNVEKIENIIKQIIKRHESLRTRLYVDGVDLRQEVLNDVMFNIQRIEMDVNDNLNDIIYNSITNFNLDQAPLFKAVLINVDKDENYLIFNFHHSIADGISMNIFIKEFIMLYRGERLLPLQNQYRDFVNWERKYLKSDERNKNEKFWLDKIDDNVGALNLPSDYKLKPEISFKGSTVKFKIENYVVDELKKIAKDNNCSLFMLLVAAFNILLKRLSGNNDIVISTPVTNRGIGQFEDSIGMFANTILLRNTVDDEKVISTFLDEVKKNCLEAYSNMYYPYSLLVNKSNTGKNYLNKVMFIYENVNMRMLEVENLEIIPYEYNTNASDFDLTLEILEENGNFDININYKTALYKEDTIKRWGRYYSTILNFLANNKDPFVKIKDVEIIDEAEKYKLLVEFNDTEIVYSKDKTIHRLFEETVERNPHDIAIVFENKEITYEELNEKSNQLARVLKEDYFIRQGDVIALNFGRSIEMVIGIIATLKANAICLPIDTRYPNSKVLELISDSKVKVVLNNNQNHIYEGFDGKIITYNKDLNIKKSKENLTDKVDSNTIAYLIYTSGSTGKSKGVMITHKGIVNHSLAKIKEINMCKDDRCCHNLSFNFVASIWQIFSPLFLGCRVYLYNEETIMDGYNLFNNVEKNQISIVEVIPSLLNSFLELEKEQQNITMNKLKCIVLTGEKVSAELVNKFYSRYTTKLLNAYGQTEVSDDTIHYHIPYNTNTQIVPIGKPSSNTRVYILDKTNKIVPIGVIGEICISGDGITKGYLNNEVLTKKKFVVNPYEYRNVLYKTGDLGRWLPDGNIEFMGRMDNQVKIRGFRIELGEIENNLLKIDGIKECVVVDKGDEANKYLSAYYVSNKEIEAETIKKELKKLLPDYMVPLYFNRLSSIPLSQNGKLDRKKLLILEDEFDNKVEYEGPKNNIQKILINIWKNILDIDVIGINDNFFDVGGHSLKATILASMIQKELGVKVPLRVIFEYGNIKGLSEYIIDSETTSLESINISEEKEFYEASSAQKRMYVIQEVNEKSTAYNMPVELNISGNIDKSQLNEIFLKIINRHEILRTSFHNINNIIFQKICRPEDIKFEVEEIQILNEDYLDAKINEFIKPFNLQEAPLLRVGLIKLENNRNIMLLDMHHIISDGTSMSILTKEFSQLYNGNKLKPLSIQYKDYSEWQLNYRNSDEFRKQEEYWLNEFKDNIPQLNMPTDYERTEFRDYNGDNIFISLGKELSFKVRSMMKETGNTIYIILLANLNILLSKYSRQEDVIIGTPIAGRNHIGLENVIGMFVNTLPIKSTVSSNLIFKDYLKVLREKVLNVYENQDYQFEEMVEKLTIRRSKNRNPLFDIIFAVQNFESRELNMDTLLINEKSLNDNLAKFDITIEVEEKEDDIHISINYANSLYTKDTIEKLMEYYKYIIRTTCENSEILLSDIELITDREESNIIEEMNCSYEEEVLEFEF